METKREHIRIYVSMPLEYRVQLDGDGDTWASEGVLKNISQGGLYFECETMPQLKRGDLAEFTFSTNPPNFSFIHSPLRTQAVVKRIESRVAGKEKFGVALQFLSNLPDE
jgi:hypothetical protein